MRLSFNIVGHLCCLILRPKLVMRLFWAFFILIFHTAIKEDDCDVIAYTAWSLLDNFEWAAGYTEKFGLHYVEFNDTERPRSPKASAKYYAQLIRDNGFVERELNVTTEPQPDVTTESGPDVTTESKVDVSNVSSYSFLLLTICFTIFMLPWWNQLPSFARKHPFPRTFEIYCQ